MSGVEASVPSALALARSGRLADAANQLRTLINRRPNDAEAHYWLGAILLEAGQAREAAAALASAAGFRPDDARTRATHGLALHEGGQRDRAIAEYDAALALDSGLAETWFHRGNALGELGQRDAAIQSYRRAVSHNEPFAEARINLAACLKETGDAIGAISELRRAVADRPDLLVAWRNLIVMEREGFLVAAEAHAREATARFPNEIWFVEQLALIRAERGGLEEAEELARRVFAQSPGAAGTLARVLHAAGRAHEAIPLYQRALEQRPSAEDLNNLATALRDQGRIEESLSRYREAVALDPGYERARANLVGLLVERDELVESAQHCHLIARGRPDEALWDLRAETACPTLFDSVDQIAEYRETLARVLDRHAAMNRRYDVPAIFAAQAFPSFNLPFHGLDDRPLKEAFARVYQPSFPMEAPPSPKGRPKVGIVITHGHEAAFLRSMQAMFPRFSPDRLDIDVVCSAAGAKNIEPALRGSAARVHPLSSEIGEAIEQIRAARYDLLYFREIGTDAINYFLPFLRLAPIQCNTYGIQVTSGNASIDTYVSSELIEAADADAHYTEKLVRFKTLLVDRSPLPSPKRPRSRTDLGLPERGNLYLCAQQLGKFHPAFDAALASILREDPDGWLVITRGVIPSLAERLAARLRRTLADVVGRVLFIPQQKGGDYASLILAADVILDPIPFGGMNTSYDPFSLGKVVVTLPSRFQRGRYTLGCYRAMGIDGPIARDQDDYIRKAVALGRDPERRQAMEALIRERSHVLFHNAEAARELEAFWIAAIERRRAIS